MLTAAIHSTYWLMPSKFSTSTLPPQPNYSPNTSPKTSFRRSPNLHKVSLRSAGNRPAINTLIKETATKYGLKMPKLAMPLRTILTGQAQTPSVDAVITLIGREKTLKMLSAQIK